MNLTILRNFRHEMYGCFEFAADALFNTVDALSSETEAHSFPELSLSAFFPRKWASLYEAFEDGKIDAEQLRRVFVHFAPLPPRGAYVFVGVDTSPLLRPQADTSADRVLVPLPNVPESAHAVCPAWHISSVVLLPEEAGQGTFVLDTQRVASSELATHVAASQLRAVVELLVQQGLRVVILGDRWYACVPFLLRMREVAARCLLRLKCNRVLYRRAPARTPQQRGASRKDGARFQGSESSTHGVPDASWEGTDPSGKRVEVHCWHQLHLRAAREIEVSVIQVIRYGASDRQRDPRVSWFLWKGDEPAPLADISPIYRRRYSQEHGFRLDKQVLLWQTPRLRTPAQTERWTLIVACAHNQLVLARCLGEGRYRPWETRRSVLTLAQVRRVMPAFLMELGTPARPPQPRGKAPGRAKGFHPKPATRYPVVRKTPKKVKKRTMPSSMGG